MGVLLLELNSKSRMKAGTSRMDVATPLFLPSRLPFPHLSSVGAAGRFAVWGRN